MDVIRGAYSNGFAPRDGMPLYPSLWQGCVGAWAPCLGPSGLVLRDWSGRGNHGTLTNMDAASDWVVTNGGYALDFDGTNDHVALANLAAATQWSVAAWVMHRAPLVIYSQPVCVVFGASTNNGIVNRLGFWQGMRQDSTASFDSREAIVAGVWQHIAVTWDGSAGRFYANGRTGSASSVTDSGWGVGGTKLGDGFSTNKTNGQIDDVRVYNRVLTPQEVRLLASRRGIAYDMVQPIWYTPEQAAGFNAAWALRQRQILGAGGGLG